MLTILVAIAPQGAFAAAKPNVIIVLVDDVGYGDFSCHGNPIIKTPLLDRLRRESIRLTDFHVSPMCTPTRSQLMTGRDALDNGAMNVSSGRSMLRRGIATMADAFAASGYKTGLFGKWHLGDVYPYRPQDRGFQKAIWFPSSHISSAPDHWNNDYFDPYFRLEDGIEKQFAGYCTDIFCDQAIGWIKQRAESNEPFFAYVPLNAAHAPLWVPDRYRQAFLKDNPKMDPKLASFYGMIVNIDENLARLDSALDRHGVRENTILIFMTDNGGTVGVKTFNAGMKGGKITLWEGGHRVPCFIRWPAGKLGLPRDIDTLTQVQDLFPTLIDCCELKPPTDPKFSGVSLTKLIRGDEQALADRMLVVQFSRMNHAEPEKNDATVLWKKWRLIKGTDLYDVSSDLMQDHNIAADHPEIVQKMTAHYDAWWKGVSPRVNEMSAIAVGADAQPVTLLCAPDWKDVILDQQREVREGKTKNAPFRIEVARDGTYSFELRRWPREADAAITAGLPAHKFTDGDFPAGEALPIAEAQLRVGEFDSTQEVKPDDKFVRFTVPLKAGATTVQSWFLDQARGELCGAYYVYVQRQP